MHTRQYNYRHTREIQYFMPSCQDIKKFYMYTLYNYMPCKISVGYTTAKSQLFSSFAKLHNPLSRKGTKLHCDTNLNSAFKFRILHELSVFSVPFRVENKYIYSEPL